MGATSLDNQTELTDDFEAFYERTGLIFSYLDILSLGFGRNDTYCGFFTGSQQELELVDFCKKKPWYHIITITGPGRYENRYMPGERLFYLGDGDKNPNLVL